MHNCLNSWRTTTFARHLIWRTSGSTRDTLGLVPQQLAKRHLLLPVESDGINLKVVLADPDDQKACEAVQGASRRQLLRLVGLRHELKKIIDDHYARYQRELASGSSKATRVVGPES